MLLLERRQLETMERQMFEALRRGPQGEERADMALFIALGLASRMLPRETRPDLIRQSLESSKTAHAAKPASIDAQLAAVSGTAALALLTQHVT